MAARATGIGLSLAALLLAGCSSDEPSAKSNDTSEQPSPAASSTVEPPTSPPSTPATDDPIFPGTPNPLSFYKGQASYPYRVNIVKTADELLAAMRLVNPDLDEGDFSDVISTCEDVAGGEFDTDALLQRASVRFDVDEGKAGLLVGTSKRFACPKAG